ncbi:hypothetical protein PQX77_010659 [Marasmius sp. AFHP31]|nr:hypothetical protein PQX77_010659 [Marasmius sp. AFHP31]
MPTTLHLAGKSPVFLDSAVRSYPLQDSMGEISESGIGKWDTTSGVSSGGEERVVEVFQNVHGKFFPNGSPPPAMFSYLVETEYFYHVASLINRPKGEIVLGGEMVGENGASCHPSGVE